MSNNHYTVRLVKPAKKPTLPKVKIILPFQLKEKGFFNKINTILSGSTIGLLIGGSIYLMLKTAGLDMAGLESYVIVGIPSLLGLVTSVVIF